MKKYFVLRFLSLVLCGFCLTMLCQTVTAQFAPVRNKISGDILAHMKAKSELKGITAAAPAASAARPTAGMRSLDSEECALYVAETLDEDDITSYAARGIIVHETYIPPLPDKQHFYGFYLATVDYDSLDDIEAIANIVRLESTEFLCEKENHLATLQTMVDDVRGRTSLTGAGVVSASPSPEADATSV